MKNPLGKRIKRELRQDVGKYIVIFLFLVLTIGFVSGFLVAGQSMKGAYWDAFEKYNIEDGHFTLDVKTETRELEKLLEQWGINVYENPYVEQDILEHAKIRIYPNREQVNQVNLMAGSLPQKKNEIAIDRLFAQKNKLSNGDSLAIDGTDYSITGLVAMPDYSALFSNNGDLVFDAGLFCVGITSQESWEMLSEDKMQHNYSWKFVDTTLTDKEKKDTSVEMAKALALVLPVTDFLAEADNQAVHFVGEDLGKDESMILTLLYIVIMILAFIFTVTIQNTIEKESGVIGTLKASGYTKRELLIHYLMPPLLVTAVGAVLGNVLGYTVFKNMIAELYYQNYSLPVYETRWNGNAFLITTMLPCGIMLFINSFTLYAKLSLAPLKFLRKDLRKHKAKRAVRLPEFGFLRRFRIRILLQNMPNYTILLLGILVANSLLMLGLMLTPLLNNYGDEIVDSMICQQQYVLKSPVETEDLKAEKYAMTTLLTNFNEKKEEIKVYGIEEDSAYMKDLNFSKGTVAASEGILEKYGVHVGDSLSLKSEFTEDTYDLEIEDTQIYPASLAIFMSREDFCRIFEKEEGYFNGYFSDIILEDIEEKAVASIITEQDMTKAVRQLKDSFGELIPMITVFSIVLYMLIIYLLSKIVIEKNAEVISMVKILGFQNREISRLFISATTMVTLGGIFISLPLAGIIMEGLYGFMMNSFSGWMTFYIEPLVYGEMAVLGIGSYSILALLQYGKIGKVPLADILKK